jgi:hypothetical protein
MKTTGETRRRDAVLLGLALLVCLSTGLAQTNKKSGDQTSRSVQGVVTSPEDTPVAGAVVQLKNTKTLQIRSFIAKEDGSYYFNGLSPDVDYELRAEFQGMSSSSKTLSSFDTRKAATINLKLNKK